ncbi:tail fiber protein [Escherichia coli SHECO003]|nr:tail fiber protein [Escherichia coli SHECO003]
MQVHRVQRETPGQQARQAHRDRKEKQVRLARWGQPDLRDRRATRGRHKSVFVWGRRALLRQTAMAGSRKKKNTDGALITGLTFLDPKDATQVQGLFRHLQVRFGDGPWQDVKGLDEVGSDTGRTGE